MQYEDQYYIIMKPDSYNYPKLSATRKTEARKYMFDPVLPFSEPLFFQDSSVNSKVETHPLLLTLNSFIADKAIRDYFFKNIKLKSMHFHPAVYIDNKGDWHENYWYLNIYGEFDCWDRDKSIFEKVYSDDDDLTEVDIIRYSLNSQLLDTIDENERLIFRMGGTADTPLFIHQRILNYFKENNITGYRAFKVSEYEFGMEF